MKDTYLQENWEYGRKYWHNKKGGLIKYQHGSLARKNGTDTAPNSLDFRLREYFLPYTTREMILYVKT